MYRRYSIVDAEMLREGAAKLAAYNASREVSPEKKVLVFEQHDSSKDKAQTVGTP